MTDTPAKPASAVNRWTGPVGVLALFGALVLLRTISYPLSAVEECFFLLAFSGSAMALYEILIVRVHLHKEAGLAWENFGRKFLRSFTDSTLAVKILGMLVSLGCIAFVWSAPLYTEDFYRPYFDFLHFYIWLIVAVGIVYFLCIHAVMEDKRDGFWHLGAFFIPSLHLQADRSVLKAHMLSLCVKMFFLPLMFIFFYNEWSAIKAYTAWPQNFRETFDMSIHTIFFLDVAFAIIGYVCTLRLFDAHIRRPETRWGGWVVCLICYAPFNQIVFDRFLRYNDNIGWNDWLAFHPVAYGIWGSLILLSYAVYVAATVNAGLRFSNLTHRGILTHGMYAYTKHPAYISKNFAWWLEHIPFVAMSATASLKHSLVLCAVNYIYYLRAKYEEKTLSENDETYRQYAEYIRQNGIFVRLKRVIGL